jgi:eukaryotic-like serine/threonine-protein kinase
VWRRSCRGISENPRSSRDHVSDPIAALAHLQLGRAFALSGDNTKAKAAYQDLLILWKDDDQDIPILKQVRKDCVSLN